MQAVTIHLATTYHLCNDKFTYEPSQNVRRCLTKLKKGVKNAGFNNEENHYILYVNDVLGVDIGPKFLILDILQEGASAQVVKCHEYENIGTGRSQSY